MRLFLKEMRLFLEEKSFFLEEKWFFLEEKSFFLEEMRLFLKEKSFFLEVERHFLEEKPHFLQEKSGFSLENGLFPMFLGLEPAKTAVLLPVGGECVWMTEAGNAGTGGCRDGAATALPKIAQPFMVGFSATKMKSPGRDGRRHGGRAQAPFVPDGTWKFGRTKTHG